MVRLKGELEQAQFARAGADRAPRTIPVEWLRHYLMTYGGP